MFCKLKTALNVINIRPSLAVFLAVPVMSVGSWHFLASPPVEYPVGEFITIEAGSTLNEIAELLKHRGVVRSLIGLRLAISLTSSDKNIQAGKYFFSRPQNVLEVAEKITVGDYERNKVEVTIPEGVTASEIAFLLSDRMSGFNKERFLRLALPREGRLFPDTYVIFEDNSPAEVVGMLEKSFFDKTAGIKKNIEKSGRSMEDIVTMASLLEKEASDLETRRMIAGILWKRLDLNMPLQVDATFLYINGKNTYELTREDLATTSPYNTYKNIGLPPTPITNPGFDAILAAATPTESDYLFYLSDRAGNTYYAETFEEHKAYKKRYVY